MATYKDIRKSANAFMHKNHKKAISDPTYPIYHLRAPSGWINDPCGLFHFNSSFHIFCQSNPWSNQWGNMTWSHVVSDPDSKWNFKWFYPIDNGTYDSATILQSQNINAPDKDGIFTGCAEVLPFKEKDINGNDIVNYYPTVFYSAVWGIGESTQEVICAARALKANITDETGTLVDPFLQEWTKFSSNEIEPNSNPEIIIKQPEKLNLISFRDPFLFRLPEDNNYYMIVSAGIIDNNNLPQGTVILYKNDGKNLFKNWQRVNKGNNFFFKGNTPVKDPITSGGDFECAAIYKLTDHIGTTNNTPYILVYGHDGPPDEPYGKSIFYTLGNIEKNKDGINFVPLSNFIDKNGNIIQKHIDLNPEFFFYASNVMPVDNEQRKYLLGWLNVESQANDGKNYNWAGALSIPRFLFAYKNNGNWELGQDPALINALRKEKIFDSNITFDGKKTEIFLANVKGRHLNIDCIFEGKALNSNNFGFKILGNKNIYTDIKLDKGKIVIGNRKPIDLDLPNPASKIGLNFYIDGSILEIFISKEFNNTLVSYQTFSCALPNNGNLTKEQVKIFGNSNITASVKAYSMETCWVEQPTFK